jgi:hypothetical protein
MKRSIPLALLWVVALVGTLGTLGVLEGVSWGTSPVSPVSPVSPSPPLPSPVVYPGPYVWPWPEEIQAPEWVSGCLRPCNEWETPWHVAAGLVPAECTFCCQIKVYDERRRGYSTTWTHYYLPCAEMEMEVETGIAMTPTSTPVPVPIVSEIPVFGAPCSVLNPGDQMGCMCFRDGSRWCPEW